MGHLLTPCHPLHEPIEVPFVCNKLGEYDGGPLSTYPVGKGRANLTDQTRHLRFSLHASSDASCGNLFVVTNVRRELPREHVHPLLRPFRRKR